MSPSAPDWWLCQTVWLLHSGHYDGICLILSHYTHILRPWPSETSPCSRSLTQKRAAWNNMTGRGDTQSTSWEWNLLHIYTCHREPENLDIWMRATMFLFCFFSPFFSPSQVELFSYHMLRKLAHFPFLYLSPFHSSLICPWSVWSAFLDVISGPPKWPKWVIIYRMTYCERGWAERK